MKPISEAAERNKLPILKVLQTVFADRTAVLEIGSGTGQHAVFFASALHHLTWQPTELSVNFPSLHAGCRDSLAPNLFKPVPLDVDDESWLVPPVDAVFTANTLHIVSWLRVCCLFVKAGALLPDGGTFCSYGPFNVDGRFTSPSNAHFDAYLRLQDPESGIRDIGDLAAQAEIHHLLLEADHILPANNRMLVWRKHVKVASA
ncbi:MAG: DUF938 domain-containing protein [Nitrosomonas sp.]|nr:DUF938 domain-containing protein [Nitrosomonas sp.]MDP1950998.1 DUF938 domain-containing protein [Nitrosomonas sp.]